MGTKTRLSQPPHKPPGIQNPRRIKVPLNPPHNFQFPRSGRPLPNVHTLLNVRRQASTTMDPPSLAAARRTPSTSAIISEASTPPAGADTHLNNWTTPNPGSAITPQSPAPLPSLPRAPSSLPTLSGGSVTFSDSSGGAPSLQGRSVRLLSKFRAPVSSTVST